MANPHADEPYYFCRWDISFAQLPLDRPLTIRQAVLFDATRLDQVEFARAVLGEEYMDRAAPNEPGVRVNACHVFYSLKLQAPNLFRASDTFARDVTVDKQLAFLHLPYTSSS